MRLCRVYFRIFQTQLVLCLKIIIAIFCFSSAPTIALTHEELLQMCRESAGAPILKSCTGQPKNSEYMRECREKSSRAVNTCYQAQVQKEAAKKAAPKTPTGPKQDISTLNLEAMAPTFVAPPRTIADIAAILEKEKPDPEQIKKLQSSADLEVPKNYQGKDLVQFYYDRGNARYTLGRTDEALQDGLDALRIAKGQVEVKQTTRIRHLIALQYKLRGEFTEAIKLYKDIIKEGNQPGSKGTLISSARNIAQVFISIGDVNQADSFVKNTLTLVQEARTSPHPNWKKSYSIYKNSWEAEVNLAQGLILEARGQYAKAEEFYRRSEAFRRAAIPDLPKYDYPLPAEQVRIISNQALLKTAHVLMKQGGLNEAEATARRALLDSLNVFGKYHPSIPPFILGLAEIILEQGRIDEAGQLTQTAFEIFQQIGVGSSEPQIVAVKAQLANIFILQNKDKDALDLLNEIDKSTENWSQKRRELFALNGSRVEALYKNKKFTDGVNTAQKILSRQIQRFGEKHLETAYARGDLARGYEFIGRIDDALKEYRNAIPILIASLHDKADEDDTTILAARKVKIQTLIENYISLLNQAGQSALATSEGFTFIETIRGQSVQNALAASSARMNAKNPQLSDMIRKEQDLAKQISAQLGTLNNALSLSSDERDESGIRSLRILIEKLKNDRDGLRQKILKQEPEYAELTDPKAPTPEVVQKALRQGESLLSFYFGREKSFVWAIPSDGQITFKELSINAAKIENDIGHLREALEPNASTIADIPAFDLKKAYEIYQQILKPIDQTWLTSDKLIIVTNGAMGLLPLSILPKSLPDKVSSDHLFSEYRHVDWLARSHAISNVPSGSALIMLRKVSAAGANREPLIGFGDPLFSKAQAEEMEGQAEAALDQDIITSRGSPRLARRSALQRRSADGADISELPRLPDTADELRSIANALGVDAEKTLYLGKKANEKNVLNTDLTKYKIVAFATHGLVSGDLAGLTQPALALTAPIVAGIDGDGLLTMEEILGLKLNADWVILSACNTAAGMSASAEAASGLGRAFFYAGTRSVLVTNWSVHSQSAKILTTDLFKRQAENPNLTRAKALQEAMLALIDGPGYQDASQMTLFSYAHPLFWAPYSIIGDGGR